MNKEATDLGMVLSPNGQLYRPVDYGQSPPAGQRADPVATVWVTFNRALLADAQDSPALQAVLADDCRRRIANLLANIPDHVVDDE